MHQQINDNLFKQEILEALEDRLVPAERNFNKHKVYTEILPNKQDLSLN